MAENMPTMIERNIRELRRLNAVPLDLSVRKRIKLDEETDSAVPPTPAEEIAQPSWPNPEGSSEASMMNVSPLEKTEETGTDTTEKNALVKAWLEINEGETPADAQPPCHGDACRAPISKRHIKRRLLPKGCKPKKLFKKQASSSSRGTNASMLQENVYYVSVPRKLFFLVNGAI
ncbi:hypothetical protein HOLleu_11367 [Holothuria leucospilota]|uniref:Uncharacterized protein n=1 Tax=Holothuria leucospilota TaxID=206669 RepID=A0A9Q1HGD6_HOLLE|nr:hypothetical protein HOLleu_11367 [Holothuria leucospilota]